MVLRQLSSDIVALIHNIELNETGWLDQATIRAIKFLLWILDQPVTVEDIVVNQTQVNISHLTNGRVREVFQILEKHGALVEVSNDRYRLSQKEFDLITGEVAQAEVTEKAVRDRILRAAVDGLGPNATIDLDALWHQFHRQFIIPFIHENGAKAYELMAGVHAGSSQGAFFAGYLNRFPPDQLQIIDRMQRALFDRKDKHCRSYVLRLLKAFFFRSATQLPKEAIDHLFGAGRPTRRIRLILDTNFLFSLLDLHDNPSNEAVRLLIETIRRVPDRIQIKLYVLPATVDEFRRSLTTYEYSVSQIRMTKNLVDAASRMTLPGVIVTYFRRCQSSKYRLTPKDYFAPYHENIIAILKERGVEIFQVGANKYSQDQRVIDDALERDAYFKQRFANRRGRQRSYEQTWHDTCLWYTVRDQRPAICDTIFDADWLGVTIDYSLIAFDEIKRKDRGVPCVVHPSSLVQALQLVVPNDDDLEETLVALMQLPFLFDSFDAEDERASLQILSVLSRYENIDDLSVEVITELLGDKALKVRIVGTHDHTKEVELVREAVLEHYRDLEARHTNSLDELDKAGDELESHKKQIEYLSQEIEESRRDTQEVNHQNQELRSQISEEAKNRSELETLILYIIIAASLLVSVGSVLCMYWLFWEYIKLKVGTYVGVIALGAALPLIIRGQKLLLDRLPRMREKTVVKLAMQLDRLIWWIYGILTISIVSGFCWEVSKDLFLSTNP